MSDSTVDTPGTRYFKGFPASPGIAIGKVFLVKHDHAPPSASLLNEDQIEDELTRFRAALEKAREHIRDVMKKANDSKVDDEHTAIFESHLMMLDDPMVSEGTIERIKKERMNAEKVFYEVYTEVYDKLNSLDDEHFRARASDVQEIGQLVMSILRERHTTAITEIPEDSIVVSHDLGPGETVHMSGQKVNGFAIDVGGPTSHTAIMALALRIPAVVAASTLTQWANDGDDIIIDGDDGLVILNPEPDVIEEYQLKKSFTYDRQEEIDYLRDLPATSQDDHTIELSANVELEQEVPGVLANGADGIGLYRTEFLFVGADHPPGEEEQFQVYKRVAQAVAPKPVIFRTIDVGGDKFASTMPIEKELNPFLGLRAIRLYRQYPDIFREQLRAMLRASVFGKVRIMFPMVSLIEEVSFAVETVRQEMSALEFYNVPFDPNIELGIMIETPAAAMISDILARKVNFFSIGTNDLIQYTLAVDRNNQSVMYLYEPFNPSVLRTIKQVIDNAHEQGIWVGVCGEMAGDPYSAVILLGLGVDELSMGPIHIPSVKRLIRNVNITDARDLAGEVLECSSASEVQERISKALHRLYVPDQWLPAESHG